MQAIKISKYKKLNKKTFNTQAILEVNFQITVSILQESIKILYSSSNKD
jgi:hypothetical protein